MNTKTNNPKFVLASTSLSRKKILKNAGIIFISTKPLCDENKVKLKHQKKTPLEISKILAFEKAKSVSNNFKNKYVVGCDTVISMEKKLIEKVERLSLARKKIKRLSGKRHTIYSSVCVFKNNSKVWSDYDKTNVYMRKLSDRNIKKYLKEAGNQILTSVGCYQIEKLGPSIIYKINGDFFNVMGFPLFKFYKFYLTIK